MVNRCFRQQHLECYGRDYVPEAAVPGNLRFGYGEDLRETRTAMAEEPMGNGESLDEVPTA